MKYGLIYPKSVFHTKISKYDCENNEKKEQCVIIHWINVIKKRDRFSALFVFFTILLIDIDI